MIGVLINFVFFFFINHNLLLKCCFLEEQIPSDPLCVCPRKISLTYKIRIKCFFTASLNLFCFDDKLGKLHGFLHNFEWPANALKVLQVTTLANGHNKGFNFLS